MNEIYEEYQKAFPNQKSNFVPGTGGVNADIFFIGEAPGANEDREQVPFIGNAGAIFDRLLDSISLTRYDVFVTNLFKYRPPNNRQPYPFEIAKSTDLLTKEIKLVNPKIIVPMGTTPTGVFFPMSKFKKVKGRVFPRGDRLIFCTWHPAVALYYEDMLPKMEEHFQLIRQALDGS